MVITPERVKSLSLKHLTLRVVFIGFTDEESIEKILEYSNTNHDWIYKKISQEDGGDDSIVKEWLKNEIVKNKKLASWAEEYGYKFFSSHEKVFEEFQDEVVTFLFE